MVGGDQAALAAECADEQGEFWPYHDALYERFREQTVPEDFVALAEELELDAEAFRTCLDDPAMTQEIVGDYNDGRSYGISGTPTFFVNGVRVVGAQPLAVFQSIIDEELAGGQ